MNGLKAWRKNMSENKGGSGGNCLGSLIFVIFLMMKLTEKCAFWGDNFPRFLHKNRQERCHLLRWLMNCRNLLLTIII